MARVLGHAVLIIGTHLVGSTSLRPPDINAYRVARPTPTFIRGCAAMTIGMQLVDSTSTPSPIHMHLCMYMYVAQ
jgi:hypothetical protein